MIDPQSLFKEYNLLALIGWLFLFFLPHKKITRILLLSGAWSLFMAISYLIFLLIGLQHGPDLDFGSIEGVMKIFSGEWGVLTGWVHYLCFDLVIGCWEVSDAKKHGIRHWVILPCLFLTFMLGPLGFLLYWIIRTVKLKKAEQLF